MTSNLGSEYILDGDTSRVMGELRIHFRPEFINRVDEIVIFKPLSKDVIYQILDKIIADIEHRLRHDDLHLELTQKAKDYLVEQGYDINYGARPLKREVSKTVESLLAHELVKGTIPYGAHITFDVKDNDIAIAKIEVK